MSTAPAIQTSPTYEQAGRLALSWRSVVLLTCLAAFSIPTMMFVARASWSTEQGAHGPIVLFTGAWLASKLWPCARAAGERAPLLPVAAAMGLLLPVYWISRVAGIVEVEGYAMYALLVATLYSMVGVPGLRLLWFPILYLTFLFPPPETLVALLTQPMKIFVSQVAVHFLSLLGYPIGGEGVFIYIGPYQLLVAAACSGLNSIISLSAIALLYIYLRHRARFAYALVLALFIVPVALVANLVRVLILILLTYHLGEAAGQGFLHAFAGVTMFVAALLTIMALDVLFAPMRHRLSGPSGRLPFEGDLP